MSYRNPWVGLKSLVGLGLLGLCGVASAVECPAYLNREFQVLRSKESFNICKTHAGKPVLIVNTASHCGFTPQFKALQAIHEKYKDRGLLVVGFPSNDFNQEAGDESKTAEVCFINYGVKFTMLAPSSVRGSNANPVFKELARQTNAPAWNFNKYLVSGDGRVIEHFGSTASPDSKKFTDAIDAVLAGTAAK
jgi:glutathione peroxidase